VTDRIVRNSSRWMMDSVAAVSSGPTAQVIQTWPSPLSLQSLRGHFLTLSSVSLGSDDGPEEEKKTV